MFWFNVTMGSAISYGLQECLWDVKFLANQFGTTM